MCDHLGEGEKGNEEEERERKRGGERGREGR